MDILDRPIGNQRPGRLPGDRGIVLDALLSSFWLTALYRRHVVA